MTIDINKLTPFERILLNAAIVGGIAFFSTLSVAYPPTMANLYAAIIGFALAVLTMLKTLTVPAELIDEQKPRPPSSSALAMLI